MFCLQHVVDLGFINVSPEEGLFIDFPEETRNSLAKLLCSSICSGKVAPSQLLTSVHVCSILETVGQAFSLPLQYGDTIEEALLLYKSWLLEPKRQPAPIRGDEQFFFKKMLQHLSLIFTPRASKYLTLDGRLATRDNLQAANNEISAHINYCSSALNIFRNLGVRYGRSMENDTWEVLLKILLGIADSMISQPKGNGMVVETLISDLINILFELWLTSGPRSAEMWEHLSKIAKKWRHRLQIFTHWSAVCICINNRVLRLLYGPSQGTKSVRFLRNDDQEVEIDFEDGELFIVWHRMLHLLGSFEGTISLAENYFEAMKGISSIAKSFMKLSEQPSTLRNKQGAIIPPPSGSTILNICGGWLFESINNFQKGFEDGKKEALKTLCTLFAEKSASDFSSKDLAHFYRGIEKALNTHNTTLLNEILLHSQTLFLRQFRGSHILIPAFVNAFGRVLFVDAEGSVAKELSVVGSSPAEFSLGKLQKASIQMILSLLGLPKHYNSAEFFCNSRQNSPLLDHLPVLSHFSDMNDHMGELILKGLEHIQEPETRQAALWAGFVLSLETIDTNTNFLVPFVDLLLSKLTLSSWEHNDLSCVLTVLRDLTSLFSYVDTTLAKRIIITCCSFIADTLQKLNSSRQENLILCAYEVCLEWILIDQWILECPTTLQSVVAIAETGLNFVYDAKKVDANLKCALGKEIKGAAEYFLYAFVNNFGQFPLRYGPDGVSSLRGEAELIKEENAVKDSFIAVGINSKILSLCELPSENGTKLFCVTRGAGGRQIWTNSKNYFIKEVQDVPAMLHKDIPPSNIPPLMGGLDKEALSSLSSDNPLHAETQSMIEQYIAKEKEILKKNNFGLDVDISIPTPQVLPGNTPVIRLFCSNFGLTSLPNWGTLSTPKITFDQNNEVTAFKPIDKEANRECYAAGVLYFKKESSLPTFDLKIIPEDFSDFVWSLGWKVELSKHFGYRGGLVANRTGDVAPYYASHNTELIFQVGLFVPKAANENYIQNLIFSNQTVICWTEDISSFDPTLFKTEFQILIVIQPQENRLFRVKIFRPQMVEVLGPIQDEMILSKHVLGPIIRLTVLNGSRGNSYMGAANTYKLSRMRKEIDTCQPPNNLCEFYSPIFPFHQRK